MLITSPKLCNLEASKLWKASKEIMIFDNICNKGKYHKKVKKKTELSHFSFSTHLSIRRLSYHYQYIGICILPLLEWTVQVSNEIKEIP